VCIVDDVDVGVLVVVGVGEVELGVVDGVD